MKFTYWSGNKKELEEKLRDRETDIESFASRLGLDVNNIRVMYNYKNQTNKAKMMKQKDLENNESTDRVSSKHHKNGMIDIRMNDKLINQRIVNRLSAVPHLIEQQVEFSANYECEVLLGHLANLGVLNSKAYKDMEDILEEEVMEPLVSLFIASYIKTKEVISNIKIVGDPYGYENHTMSENDWIDLFDICNYHRVATGKTFREATKDVYPNRINSKLNSIIDTLEKYLETYISNGGIV